MNRPGRLRVAVADDEPLIRQYFAEVLAGLGHEVIAVAATGDELVEACRRSNPDLVISDVKMPGIDGIEAAREISRIKPVPIILVSAFHDPELLDRAGDAAVLAYLVKPVDQADLEAAIAIARKRFAQFETLRRESTDLRQALADRKLIERAKGILMQKAGLPEADAFRRLQKLASQKNLKLVEVARMIVTAEEALGS